MDNINQIQKFSRAHALVAPKYAHEIAQLAAAPVRHEVNLEKSHEQCAGVFGQSNMSGKTFPFVGGVGIIPVWGALLHRDGWCDSYATGYDYIASRFQAALADPDVKGIVFDLNSYGGHVAGNFELCDDIFAARGKKPMMAIVDARALSGGYSIASAVGRIVAAPSADLGSIGVVMMHVSIAKALEDFGVKVTMIHAGEHKVDGNPFEDLSPDVREALQASVDKSYTQFVALVSKNRALDPEAVRNTEARVYDAEEAKALGLIDDVMPARAAFASFLSELNGSTQPKEGKNMSKENENQGGEDATRQAEANARQQERERIAGITSCEEAKDRQALANHFATKTSMSVEEARAALAIAPKEAAAEPDALTRAMAATGGGANVGAGNEGGEGGGEKKSRAGTIMENYAKATGIKPTAAAK